VSSCLHSSYYPTRKSSCKKLFLDENIYTESSDFKESNKGRCKDKIIGENFLSDIKNLDKQELRNYCLSEMELPNVVCTSDTKPENISESCNMADEIFDIPNRPEGGISLNFVNPNMVSLLPKIISEHDPNLSQSFEPWSIHRTPVKLRGIYLWSPFFKSK